MHEYGLCEGVLDAVRERAGGRAVAGFRLRCGIKHAVDAEAMTLAFEVMAAGTEADGARIEIVIVPATLTCRTCGAGGDTTDMLALCPRCGSDDVQITGGDELTLESVSYAATFPQ
jgi:hydrogenase nickel incorporation protein HypA/HybF